ncbi:conserved hypothetical protein [uncultured Mycobacterium sp.]|uniref:4Fe-4S Wbl-type domain-containing protein n=1 Tax=uncultured Mycobacterium sp. TaxID=171292 RepID=A0A1Y5PE51_9MYCO|nr:conserved hypothetical protein [uncultured Mycobacterium sp.]
MTTDPNVKRTMARIWHTRTATDLMASWLDAIAAVPRLDGAACRGSVDHDIDHDCDGEPPEAREERLHRAVAVCHGCPALTACRTWLDGLSARQRPTGVVAGRVVERPGANPVNLAERPAYRPTVARQTRAWLAKHLSEHGPTAPRDVLAAAEAAGLQTRSVRLAAGVLGVTRPGGRSMRWELPRHVQPDGIAGVVTQPEGEQHAG